MRWDEFVNIPNGQRVFNNGWDQCVALANLYHQDVLGGQFVPVASAYQWWTDYGRLPQLQNVYTQIPVSGVPLAGDVFLARGGAYNQRDGHIGVVIRDWNGSTFGSKEQNAENNRYVWQTYNRSKANVLGFLRPRVSPITPPQPMKNDEDEMLTLWRNSATGMVIAGSMHTGYSWHLPDPGYIQLMWERGMARNQTPINMAPNEWDFLQSLLAEARANVRGAGGSATVDVAAIARAVNDDVSRRMQG